MTALRRPRALVLTAVTINGTRFPIPERPRVRIGEPIAINGVVLKFEWSRPLKPAAKRSKIQ